MKTKVDLATFDNSWYKVGANIFKQVSWYYINLIFFKSAFFPVNRFKINLLRLFGATIDRACVIKPCVNIKYPWNLKLGDYCWIGENVWIDNLANVNIGSHVCISQGAFILCGNHNYKKKSFDLMVSPIIIKDGAWIGAKAIVCPGVTVGKEAVLSVGAVATKDLEAQGIYQGNPAVFMRKRVLS